MKSNYPRIKHGGFFEPQVKVTVRRIISGMLRLLLHVPDNALAGEDAPASCNANVQAPWVQAHTWKD